jgi:hypothetical protein
VATAIFLARNGTDRLVVRTICTHLVFFHEAGFAYHTQRRQGWRWTETDAALQPTGFSCRLNDRIEPERFGATPQERPGFYKLSCEVLSLRRHCVWVDTGGPMPREFVPGSAEADARAVHDVVVRFTYDGEGRILRHRA